VATSSAFTFLSSARSSREYHPTAPTDRSTRRWVIRYREPHPVAVLNDTRRRAEGGCRAGVVGHHAAVVGIERDDPHQRLQVRQRAIRQPPNQLRRRAPWGRVPRRRCDPRTSPPDAAVGRSRYCRDSGQFFGQRCHRPGLWSVSQNFDSAQFADSSAVSVTPLG
jgi:hypothetical protein